MGSHQSRKDKKIKISIHRRGWFSRYGMEVSIFYFDGLPMTGRTRTVAGTASCAQCERTEASRGVTREAADQLTESARVGTVLC